MKRQRGFGWGEVIIALAVIGIITAVVVGIYHKGYAAGEAKIKLEWEEAKTAQREEEIQRSMSAALGLSADRAKARTIIQERTVYVDRNIEKLVDSGVCFTPAGVSCINGSIEGKGAAGCEPDGAVPGVKPAG